MPSIRFSLLTLLLVVGAIGGAMGVWFHRNPWSISGQINHATDIATISNDGSLMVVSYGDEALRLVRADTGKDVCYLSEEQKPVNAVNFTANDRTLATGGDDQEKNIRVWDVASGKEMQILKGHTAAIYCMAFTPDMRLLVTSSCDGTLRVWDPVAGKQRASFTTGAVFFTAENISPDSHQFIFAYNSELSILDLQTLSMRQVKVEESPSKAWFISNNTFAAELEDGDASNRRLTVHLGDAQTLKVESKMAVQLPKDHRYVTAGQRWLISVKGNDGCIWDLLDGRLRSVLPDLGQAIDPKFSYENIIISPAAEHLLHCNYETKRTYIWDADTGSHQQIDGHTLAKMSPADRYLFTHTPGGEALTQWSRNRPEGRFGLLGLPEMWLFMLSVGGLLWQFARVISRIRSTNRSNPANSPKSVPSPAKI
jgi:WD40 repeat protein